MRVFLYGKDSWMQATNIVHAVTLPRGHEKPILQV